MTLWWGTPRGLQRGFETKRASFARLGGQPFLSKQRLNVALGRAFAAPTKLRSHFSRRGCRAARDKFIAAEIKNAALNVGQFVYLTKWLVWLDEFVNSAE